MTRIVDVDLTLAGHRIGMLTDFERADATSRLTESAAEFETSLAGVTDLQWIFKTSPGQWSIGECADHLAVAEELALLLVQRLLQAAKAPPGSRLTDQELFDRTLDRSSALVAPSVVRPTARSLDRTATLAAFSVARQRCIDFIASTDADLRACGALHPIYGVMDGYQWLVGQATHVRRHLVQIQQIKNADGFPR